MSDYTTRDDDVSVSTPESLSVNALLLNPADTTSIQGKHKILLILFRYMWGTVVTMVENVALGIRKKFVRYIFLKFL
jgi:hypothetical protein